MTNKLTFQEKYNAIGKQDTRYEGIFITGVKTTGIFCRPSCRARKPKAANVTFFDTAQEALQNGFRPCKVCKPMEKMDETPEYVINIIKELHEKPYLRIKDYDLKKR
ncbi:MAG: XRE family transcriptional regulator, partial [Deltaproteobacteria bacterium]|nr:XRE family transcriptional regulator [Deltaproteobacteria bacterium]